MINANTSTAIDWLFEKSVRDNSVPGPEDHCVVTRTTEIPSTDEGAKRKLVVLNISSYVFRIVALFDFDSDAATTAHLAKIARRTDQTLEGQALLDAYTEFVNMICGAVNRGLSAARLDTGMSTPFILESTCASYVSILGPERVQSFEVVINEAVRFNLQVCICVANDTTLDFNIDRSEVQESSGELEFF